jgi:hypothetical protein
MLLVSLAAQFVWVITSSWSRTSAGKHDSRIPPSFPLRPSIARAPWEDSSPAGIGQGTPGGHYPNRSSVFTPSNPTPKDPPPFGNVYDAHLRRNIRCGTNSYVRDLVATVQRISSEIMQQF